jgi:hypothetical protein
MMSCHDRGGVCAGEELVLVDVQYPAHSDHPQEGVSSTEKLLCCSVTWHRRSLRRPRTPAESDASRRSRGCADLGPELLGFAVGGRDCRPGAAAARRRQALNHCR